MLISPNKVREITGLSEDEAPDAEILPHIERAQRRLLNDIAIRVEDDQLTGSIDGTNTTFTTSHYPIADRNFDGTVNKYDITIYYVIDIENPKTYYEYVPSTIYPEYGKVIMQTPPSTIYKYVIADYYYYPREIDMELMKEACAFLSAYYYVMREYVLVPDQMAHGALRLRYAKPYMTFLEEYYHLRDILLSMPYAKGEHEAPEEIREEETE